MSQVRRAPGMPRPKISNVNGITDRAGMPRLGKLRLGEKRKSGGGKEYPAELDYFRCDPEDGMLPADRKALSDKFQTLFGERATVLRNVFLPSDEREFVFPNALEAWKRTQNGAKRWCYGDGVRAARLDFESGSWNEIKCCHVQDCPVMNAGDCKLISRLRVFLPELSMAGYWQIDTSSQASTGNIIDCLNQLEGVFGRLTNIPLVLSREPEVMTYEGKANTHYIIHLRAPNVDFAQLREMAGAQRFLLPAATVETDDVDEVVDGAGDVPEELVPGSVQEPEPDAELIAEIGGLFDALHTNAANRASKLHEYKGRETELRDRLTNIASCMEYFRQLETPRAQVQELLQAYARREGDLVIKLKSELDKKLATQEAHPEEVASV